MSRKNEQIAEHFLAPYWRLVQKLRMPGPTWTITKHKSEELKAAGGGRENTAVIPMVLCA